MSMTAIIVSIHAETRQKRDRLLEQAGYKVFTAESFGHGTELLTQIHPDLLVADVRLLDHNGLHLALRAHDESPRTRTVIVGEPDVVLERDAKSFGAWYVTSAELPSFVAATREGREPRSVRGR